MISDTLRTIDERLIAISEHLGELHAWLDCPTKIDFGEIGYGLQALEIPSDQHFLRKKRDSLLCQIAAMKARNSPEFTLNCIEYFENLVPSSEEVNLAQTILHTQQKAQKDDSRKLNAPEIAEELRKAVCQRGLEDVATVIFPYAQAGTVSIQSYLTKLSEIRVSPTVEKTQRGLEKTIAHEIEGHLYRSLNGRQQFPQSAFYSGTSGGYLMAEEGFTDHIETMKGRDSNDRIPAAHVIAVDAMLRGAAYEDIKKLLVENGITEKNAASIATKAKRGVDPNREGGYVGGAAYLLGRLRVGDFLKKGGRAETLYAGKIGLEDVPIVEEMLRSGELQPPTYVA